MGIQVMLQERVVEVTAEAVRLASGLTLATETVVWSSGVRGADRIRAWGLPIDEQGRVPVGPTLQVPGYPNVYVTGDLAAYEQDGHAVPMLAPVATQQGAHAARNILRRVSGEEQLPFHYVDRGAMVTIGRNAAVAVLGGREFTGIIAWFLWLAVHIAKLIGFRNRLQVLINWAWDYFFYERAVRLIMPWGPDCGSHDGSCKRLR